MRSYHGGFWLVVAVVGYSDGVLKTSLWLRCFLLYAHLVSKVQRTRLFLHVHEFAFLKNMVVLTHSGGLSVCPALEITYICFEDFKTIGMLLYVCDVAFRKSWKLEVVQRNKMLGLLSQRSDLSLISL
jgi:hypothetical protein